MKISIVIPVLNEAQSLSRILSIQASGIELIVVDGGSQDETVEIAKSYGVKVLHSSPGRAIQMNAGAEIATGEILLFLHADTQLPEGFDRMIRETLLASIAGAFQLKIDSDLLGVRWVERGVNYRSHFFQMPYGDQALFLRAELFHEMGGFPELPIMEDFEFVRRLRQKGRIAIVPHAVLTSGRRWEKYGVLRTTIVNQIVILAYFLGVSPAQIRHWYRTGLKSIRYTKLQ
ncbi:TIGR04283 family arsenosugar biosynthesis glycosyltransferase [Pseudanabaenaceae cyanobacterium LEGE 13415]|nr:TIGR04283 family arsenosugar biosynthesis glycosyltransferase [Pseudanabaenaceae cyanobacterium LEGE 13415]